MFLLRVTQIEDSNLLDYVEDVAKPDTVSMSIEQSETIKATDYYQKNL